MFDEKVIEQVDKFISLVQEANDKDHEENDYHDFMKIIIGYDIGKKYIKVWRESTGQRSVYCFIDESGDIYKSASWNARAKGVRGTITDVLSKGFIEQNEIYSYGYRR